MRKRINELILIVGLATAYVATARLGLAFDAVAGFATLVWPPTGIALAALLLFGMELWPGIFVGAFLANMLNAATAMLFISATAIAGTALGYGPFVQPELSNSLFLLQTFVALVATTLLVLSATIAERVTAEGEAQDAQQEAARANLVKSQFLAVMSHELRTPLNAIAGFSDLLQAGVYGSLNTRQDDALGRIRHNEKELLALIDEVLAFVSGEKGNVTLRRENVRVADAFDAVQPLIEPEIRRKHFVLKRDLSWPRLAVRADPKSLQRILVSLLSNASTYTKDGGMITLGAAREGPTVRIWVRDTGVGIPPDELAKVFDPFHQGSGGTTRRFSGVGLGLTIARDLAHSMSGEVTIASQVGSGTTASVVLPAA